MDEGVDPTKMCQNLVDKVARSRQLMAIAEPELLVLFEDWLEELEEEARMRMDQGITDALVLSRELGISSTGARFLLSKLGRQQAHQS
jgi:hypothetical protein